MKALAVVGLIAFLASPPILADCVEATDSPQVPDGATATREDMLAAHKAMQAYNAVVQAYVECLRKRGGNAARDNKAVEKLTEIADKFNAELRTFKKRNGA